MSIYLELLGSSDQDDYILAPPCETLEIPSDTIIVFNKDGTVASRFSDHIWDFSSLSSKVRYFKFDPEKFPADLIFEMKTLIYARLYYSKSARSINTLRIAPINKLATLAQKNGVTIRRLLNERMLGKYLASSLSSLDKRAAQEIAAIVKELSAIRISKPEFTIAPPSFQLADELNSVASLLPEKRTNQTLVIPTRLFSTLITSFSEFLNEFVENKESIISFMNYLSHGLETGGHLQSHAGFKRWYKKDKNYKALLIEYKLTELAEKHKLDNKKGWGAYLRDIQEASKYWIHLFTGMRNTEVNTLSRGCYGSLNTKGSKAKIIKGHTTKTLGTGTSETFWITTDIIEKAVQAARAIGDIVAFDQKIRNR